MNGTATPEIFARQQLLALLDAAVFEMHTAERLKDSDSIHRMRVAIRRFQQGLRVFAQYLPASGVKRIKRDLRELMQTAGQVRDRDITLKLLKTDAVLSKAIEKQRLEYKRRLLALLHDLGRPDLSIKWRTRLELH